MGEIQTAILQGVGDHEIRVITRLSNTTPSEKALVVFPGYRYPPDAPAIFYAQLAFLKHGWDVVAFDYRYNELPGFLSQGEEKADEQIRDEAIEMGKYIREHFPANTLCILGKSLGTTVVHHIVQHVDLQTVGTSVILLTPTEFQRELVEIVIQTGRTGFVAIGEKDPYYRKDVVEEQSGNPRIQWETIQDAGHLFEDVGRDMGRSLDNVKRVTEAIEKKISDGWFG